jgi:hypothetical protein
MEAKARDPIRVALPGFIAGCALYLAGTFFGPALGAGWRDVLQGSAFFVGLIWITISVRRQRRKQQ